MNVDIVKGLHDKIASLRIKKDSIDREIADIESAINVIERHLHGGERPTVTRSASPEKRSYVARKSAKHVIDAVKGILEDGKLRRTSELLSILIEQGVQIGGENKFAMLSTYLSRSKDLFVNDRRNGWSLKKQNPEGGDAPSGYGDGENTIFGPPA